MELSLSGAGIKLFAKAVTSLSKVGASRARVALLCPPHALRRVPAR
jgi:hypothetical protein